MVASTKETAQAVSNQFSEDEQLYADPNSDAFQRTELFTINKITNITTRLLTDDELSRRQVATDSEEYRTAFPNGVAALDIELEGVSVKYNFDSTGRKHVIIPLRSMRAGKMGDRPGRGSQMHVILEAFDQTFGIRPFGEANRSKLIGRIANWGQHLGDAKIDGSKVEWAWDVPRNVLPDDFKFEGIVKVVGSGGAAAGAAVGAVQLSEEDSAAAVVGLVSGLPVEGGQAPASERVMNTPGLTDEWYTAAAEGNVLTVAHEKGLIKVGADNTVEAA